MQHQQRNGTRSHNAHGGTDPHVKGLDKGFLPLAIEGTFSAHGFDGLDIFDARHGNALQAGIGHFRSLGLLFHAIGRYLHHQDQQGHGQDDNQSQLPTVNHQQRGADEGLHDENKADGKLIHRPCNAGDAGIAGHQFAGREAVHQQHGQFQDAQDQAGRTHHAHLDEVSSTQEVHGQPHPQLQYEQQDVTRHQGCEPLGILTGDDVVCVDLLDERGYQVGHNIHKIQQERDPEEGHAPPHKVTDERHRGLVPLFLTHSERSLAARKRVRVSSNRYRNRLRRLTSLSTEQ